MVGFHNAHSMVAPAPAGGIKITALENEQQTSKFDLSFIFSDAARQIGAQVEYNTDLYRRTSIGRMARHLCLIFDAVASAPPDRPIRDSFKELPT